MSPILLLTASIAVVGSNALVLSPLAADVGRSFGAPPSAVLLAAALYGGATAASAFLLAPQADRFGFARTLRAALATLVAAMAVSALAPSVVGLAAGQVLAGLAAGVALPSIYGLTAELAEPGHESRTLGTVLTGWTLSLVAGVSLSALLADALHWRAVYLVLGGAAAAVLAALLAARLPARARGAGASGSPVAAFAVPGIGAALAVVAGYMIAFYGLYAVVGPHLTGPLGLSTAAAGLAALSYGIGFGLAAPLDRYIDRFGAQAVAPVVFAGLAAAYVHLGLARDSAVWLLLACLPWGVSNHVALNLLVGRLTALDPARRGAVIGLYSAVSYLCMFAGTAAFAAVFDAHGFALCAVLSASAALLVLAAAILQRRAGTRAAAARA